jgi:ABC-type Zn uptake system ZnuABC Zn-binding protein ZnuA
MLLIAMVLLFGVRAEAESISVCTTTTTLGSLVKEIGGEDVTVTAFAKGTEDAHFVDPRPSFVKKLYRADLLVLNGLELEIGWLPVLLRGARNSRVIPGASGYIDASQVIAPREVPVQFDRSMGDVHPYGNPHYLLDPLNGLKVAGMIRDQLSVIRPTQREAFSQRFENFRRRLGNALVGEKLAASYDVEKLAILCEQGRLYAFLESQGEADALGGWCGLLQSSPNLKAVGDHNLWVYFADRFGVRMVGYMEPKPGIPPTTTHLRHLIEQMRAENVGIILSAPYYNPAHARFLAKHTGARIARVAHEVGGVEDAKDYLSTVDHNVRQLVSQRAESRAPSLGRVLAVTEQRGTGSKIALQGGP